ncbi:MAG TPA: MerR family transcriptional regulator [Burkholderiales bacterium]|nr:MerR family transcriptional regulator [Burkholderiales bacterium]
MDDGQLTIAGVARTAGVGVETVRYYERRGLIAQPKKSLGSYRRYGSDHVGRIRFVKRAQELGFTLDEVESLLKLEDGTDRRSIQKIAAERLQQVRGRIADLRRIERTLAHLLEDCRDRGTPQCPIIGAIAGSPSLQAPRRNARRERG